MPEQYSALTFTFVLPVSHVTYKKDIVHRITHDRE